MPAFAFDTIYTGCRDTTQHTCYFNAIRTVCYFDVMHTVCKFNAIHTALSQCCHLSRPFPCLKHVLRWRLQVPIH